MSEPTIDEMIDYLDSTAIICDDNEYDRLAAIRAILEQHRKLGGEWKAEIRRIELEAIRAFVERVTHRLCRSCEDQVLGELAAMEKEDV
jgi:hypothetical protein